MSCGFDLVTEKPPSIKFAIEPQISHLEMSPINTNKLNDTRKEKTFTTANNQLVEKENRYSVLEKTWLDCQYHDKDNQSIMTPEDLETKLQDPPTIIDPTDDEVILMPGTRLRVMRKEDLTTRLKKIYLQEDENQLLAKSSAWSLPIDRTYRTEQDFKMTIMQPIGEIKSLQSSSKCFGIEQDVLDNISDY
ncbi:unnamed protein product [Rotaria sp. Silwood1]|nr:unnamed protein product [Rotaria sp. Silwood1]